jgi:Na+/H+ antiporter NhaA
VLTSRGRHVLAREHRLRTPLGYAGAFVSNAVHRPAMGAWLERVVFSSPLGSKPAPLPFGIAMGLFLGKQIGIFSSVWLSVKLGIADRPPHASWTQMYGVALLCGIGFTMSLFIGGLAFSGPTQGDAVKIGVLMGSLLSAVLGYSILRYAAPRKRVHGDAR